MHDVEYLPAGLERQAAAFEIGFEGIELVLQGHGETPSIAVGPAYLDHLEAEGYTARPEKIYLESK